jgi:hypothetical protein
LKDEGGRMKDEVKAVKMKETLSSSKGMSDSYAFILHPFLR